MEPILSRQQVQRKPRHIFQLQSKGFDVLLAEAIEYALGISLIRQVPSELQRTLDWSWQQEMRMRRAFSLVGRQTKLVSQVVFFDVKPLKLSSAFVGKEDAKRTPSLSSMEVDVLSALLRARPASRPNRGISIMLKSS